MFDDVVFVSTKGFTNIRFRDAQNLHFVYEWRQEQERSLRASKGTGMTEEQVNHFVDGCSYSLNLILVILGANC